MLGTLSALSLPELSTVARRSALGALAVGIAALVGLGVAGYALVGLGVCLGLGMALGNFRLVSAAVSKASRSTRADKRRPLAMNTLGRLGAVSIVAIALLLIAAPLGFGTLIGLAVFQFMLLGNVTVSMLKAGALGGSGASGSSGRGSSEGDD
ncbi:MAG: hypothetical protein ACYCTL_01910 [Acidimicrobiales bacterium]